ncbi:similar to Saccharomyces cerevisiae YHL044W Putative integral membrane protein, member of DUP240 gene family [Maudiozyma barnettii]|uniref:Similar to Saccharomyces cerevisiae YHL044W Putative integral membrane protein, member of DUP240 gene family n=1 Tax=Maudiozyma barnettii TaxID=61262 RepID=A0A8H2VFY2_9SACH|nr:uncharacterized protein KABA2_04S13266 [Kazachstania barnettii]CAB4254740.1 similar to Saccharomyces cerevisiae YHL044W Putative integral membrane protein, member of DUP240 gene family [Kazachstania barnettii]CAD1782783.1 similar to Saccharomyces cerevisiae YHL044W Putative integral membrane protein, member of DUP240 gene family [Kazachstania barnettii]
MKDNTSQTTKLLNNNEAEEHVALPCDRYSSRLTFYLSLTENYLMTVIFIIVTPIMSYVPLLLGLIGIPVVYLIASFLIELLLITTIPFTFSYEFIIKKMELAGQMKFYSEIVQHKPCSDPATWNTVGCHMKLYFQEHGYNMPLYDGSDYYMLFTKMASPLTFNTEPNPASNLSQNTVGNIEQSNNDQFDGGATINDKPQKERQLVYLETAKEKAIQTFRETEDRHWVSLYPELAF